MSDRESPYRRPYPSTRQRKSGKRKKTGSTTASRNTNILRLLGFLVVVLVLALAIIFKDTGKSEMATGLLMK